jgi:hypothetical protein
MMNRKVENFSAVAYLFGHELYKTGPDISSLPVIKDMETFNDLMTAVPVVLKNTMIASLIPYTIKGVIWYQGEVNALDFDYQDGNDILVFSKNLKDPVAIRYDWW